MDPKEIEVLDRYLTKSPESICPVENEPLEWNHDDFGNTIFENDWVFIAYFNYKDAEKKFVVSQEGFLSALDEYNPANLIVGKLEIISGKEWLAMQKGND
ncbi:hypothetical protein MEPL4_4c00580 [Melissococcus plutonius]|nr:hypothetical protein [Melissococcus plutonius]AIM25774.1 hypothetical protein MEPL_c010390 [Melissococcus plutonius S1]KMT23470.1 hypothetical protein MEPL2_43p00520 [Melissococcus plutonius]KMT25228.1 hypothetical protein MEPL2_2c07860 [Melissococcus plutonius]KMT26134.1 hypothetical protein MEPL3_3c00590 [Melissococcus plutonius]KMT26864.1 hypothetical protein MEPL1_4c00590 [Melissococcus plutonius]